MATKLDVLIDLLATTGGRPKDFVREMFYHHARKGPPGSMDQLEVIAEAEADPEWESRVREHWAKNKDQVVAEVLHLAQELSPREILKTERSAASFRLRELTKDARARDRCRGKSRKELLRELALFWWPHTYAISDTDEGALKGACEFTSKLRETQPERAEALRAMLQAETTYLTLMGGARWADQAFPVVQLASHRYAAALMATSVPKEIPVKAPWSSFLIEIPRGLLWTTDPEGTVVDLSCILVYIYRAPNYDRQLVEGWNFIALSEGEAMLHKVHHTPDSLRDPPMEGVGDNAFPDALAMDLSGQDERTLTLLSRLVLNVCVVMSDPTSVRQMGKHLKGWERGPGRVTKEPLFRVFRVGRPIELDCRPALRDFVLGQRRGPLTVQFLVRGHWRNQACGPKLAQHKVIWVEPYWKGPEDAPIQVRPHVLQTPGVVEE